ncbi:hypothetical protein [Noviherbaspirillum pedocola]|uniref:Uncharacterized protein n=1 Tax=Noviherbaspirillum pedocola TaxID=2801341 RepID=A0A934W6X6_9BURK|nr:hypothetical protein [Noviherbaspirillum pedocola]MBK4736707.1 hypothetical protein [Noviherbaspirillum pedocola]
MVATMRASSTKSRTKAILSRARGRARTYLWTAAFLLQEISIPSAGTADHSIRTLAPFLACASPLKLMAGLGFALAVLALHGFSMNANLLISLIVLCMPFLLLDTQRMRIDIDEFCGCAARLIFAACVIQSLLPGLSNRIFAPFLDGFMTYERMFARASAFSMEPSFAAEMLFALAMVHVFFARRLVCGTSACILGAMLLIRASTFFQQACVFAAIYAFLGMRRLIAGSGSRFDGTGPATGMLAALFAVAIILGGYSFLVYGTLDLSFIRDSLEKYGSWRTLSNYAAFLQAAPLSFFPYHSAAGWADAISYGLQLHGLDGSGWIVQPFSAIGVAMLDLGIIGALLWIALLFHAAHRRFARYALRTSQVTIVYTLLANAIFLAPKWQLSGFLAVGLIASTLDTRLSLSRSKA